MRLLIVDILQVYVILIFARVILSYFPMSYGTGLHKLVLALDRVIEPVLGRVRRVLPQMRFGGMGVDLSPMIVLLVIELILIPIAQSLP